MCIFQAVNSKGERYLTEKYELSRSLKDASLSAPPSVREDGVEKSDACFSNRVVFPPVLEPPWDVGSRIHP